MDGGTRVRTLGARRRGARRGRRRQRRGRPRRGRRLRPRGRQRMRWSRRARQRRREGPRDRGTQVEGGRGGGGPTSEGGRRGQATPTPTGQRGVQHKGERRPRSRHCCGGASGGGSGGVGGLRIMGGVRAAEVQRAPSGGLASACDGSHGRRGGRPCRGGGAGALGASVKPRSHLPGSPEGRSPRPQGRRPASCRDHARERERQGRDAAWRRPAAPSAATGGGTGSGPGPDTKTDARSCWPCWSSPCLFGDWGIKPKDWGIARR